MNTTTLPAPAPAATEQPKRLPLASLAALAVIGFVGCISELLAVI